MTVTVNSCTPVLFADRIEPSLAFWEALGFQRSREVRAPQGHLAFAILTSKTIELMYQTVEALADEPALTRDAAATSKTFVYVEVPSLDAVKAALGSAVLHMPERRTFYGAREVGYLEPAGHFVTFAEFADESVSTAP